MKYLIVTLLLLITASCIKTKPDKPRSQIISDAHIEQIKDFGPVDRAYVMSCMEDYKYGTEEHTFAVCMGGLIYQTGRVRK